MPQRVNRPLPVTVDTNHIDPLAFDNVPMMCWKWTKPWKRHLVMLFVVVVVVMVTTAKAWRKTLVRVPVVDTPARVDESDAVAADAVAVGGIHYWSAPPNRLNTVLKGVAHIRVCCCNNFHDGDDDDGSLLSYGHEVAKRVAIRHHSIVGERCGCCCC